MANKTFGFVDSKGNNWIDGYTYTNLPIGATVSAQATVVSSATGLSINYSFSVANVFAIGNVSPAVVQLNIGSYSKTIFVLHEIAFGGCSNPLAPADTGNRTYNLTSQEVQDAVANGSIQLTAYACPGSGGWENYTMYGSVVETIPTSSEYATVDVEVSAYSTALSGAVVVLTDPSGNQYQGSTDSSGQATIKGVPIGNYQLTMDFSNLQPVSEGVNITGDSTISVTPTCASGSSFQNGSCVSGITSNITQVLTYVGIAGVVILGGYGAVKIIPKKSEYITESFKSGYGKLKSKFGR